MTSKVYVTSDMWCHWEKDGRIYSAAVKGPGADPAELELAPDRRTKYVMHTLFSVCAKCHEEECRCRPGHEYFGGLDSYVTDWEYHTTLDV